MRFIPISMAGAIVRRTLVPGRILLALIAGLILRPHAHASSGIVAPIGSLDIHQSAGGTLEMVLRDDADEAVNSIALALRDESMAGALVFVHGLPRGHVVTMEPCGKPAGFAALYRGNRLLLIQPPRLGDTDRWSLRIHTSASQSAGPRVAAEAILEIEHRETLADGDLSRNSGGQSRDNAVHPRLIVIRLKPGFGYSEPPSVAGHDAV
jgi:hypothetical protein